MFGVRKNKQKLSGQEKLFQATQWQLMIRKFRKHTIGDTSAGNLLGNSTIIGNVNQSERTVNDILFVVYTERERIEQNGEITEVTRLISARLATNFERGLYYGKYV